MKKFHSALFDFCWFPNYDASIEYLANNIADPEPWDFSDATQAKYSILKSYIEHTFRKIKSENKISFSMITIESLFVACISTEGKSMLKRLTRKRKEQNI